MPFTESHGLSRSKTYRQWAGIKHRCSSAHPYYGGRGIRLCERWKSFANFLEDVGEIPPGMTVDRIDGNGHYEPGNIRLVDAKGQARNRSNNRRITIDGTTKTVAEWQEECGLPLNTILNRIKAGKSGRDLLAPSGLFRKDRFITFRGERLKISGWAKRLGISRYALIHRLDRGWSIEKALTTTGDARRKPRKHQAVFPW